MLGAFVETVGVWFLAAVALEAIAVFVETAGAPRSPDEEKPRQSAASVILGIAATITPGLLLLHGFFLTAGADAGAARLLAVGAPVAAIMAGALVGAIFSAIAPAAAGLVHKAALAFGLITLSVTLYATHPSILALVAALQGGLLVLPVPPA